MIEDLEPLKAYVPFQIEIGCGPSVEAGIPPPHRLREIYRVTDRASHRFVPAPGADSFLPELLGEPETKTGELVETFPASWPSRAPATSHRRVVTPYGELGTETETTAVLRFDLNHWGSLKGTTKAAGCGWSTACPRSAQRCPNVRFPRHATVADARAGHPSPAPASPTRAGRPGPRRPAPASAGSTPTSASRSCRSAPGRLARDYATLPGRSEAMIHLAMTDLMARRRTGGATISWRDLKSELNQHIAG